jgi:hypothetical protein
MAECYRCGKQIDVVVYCPFCGAKQRSSLEMYKDGKTEKPPKAVAEKNQANPVPAIDEIKSEPPMPSKEAVTPQKSASRNFVIGKDIALWIIFIIVFFAFIFAVMKFWQDIIGVQ